MTMQVSDSVIYNKNRYELAAYSEKIGFNPGDFGIATSANITCCYAGYYCIYEIAAGRLVLKDLWVSNEDREFPDFWGRKFQYSEGSVNSGFYRDVLLPIKYTGTLYLGSGLMNDFYIPFGSPCCWMYEKVLMAKFDKGLLVSVEDISEEIKQEREARIKADNEARAEAVKERALGIKQGILDYLFLEGDIADPFEPYEVESRVVLDENYKVHFMDGKRRKKKFSIIQRIREFLLGDDYWDFEEEVQDE